MEVVVCRSYDEMSIQAARILADLVRARPNAVLGLPTGSTPLGLYRELVRLHREEALDFSQVTTFNLEEYVGLAPDHPQSHYRFMHEHLFDHINVPLQNIHIPSGVAESFDAHCADYEKMITDCGGIDLQVLGIGADGHIGFNEPGSPFNSRTRRVALAQQTIDDNARFFRTRLDVPLLAISMGIGTVMEAKKILLLANGPKKAGILAAAAEGMIHEMCPASVLQLHENAVVLADESAASRLTAATIGR